ncbi:MAG: F0F1 ATP synthase subunit delta [Candidatus Dormibacteria bacterium]
MPEVPRIPSTARHYAEALFQLAQEEGDFDPWTLRLERLRQLLEGSQLGATMADPSLRVAQKLEVCRAVLARDRALERVAGNLLLVLVNSRRQRLLPAIQAGYQQLVDRQEGRVLAQLTTAVPLSGAEQRRLAAQLSRRLKLEIRFESTVDKGLLGGAVVRVGDRVFDASLTTRLQQLRQELLSQVPSR